MALELRTRRPWAVLRWRGGDRPVAGEGGGCRDLEARHGRFEPGVRSLSHSWGGVPFGAHGPLMAPGLGPLRQHGSGNAHQFRGDLDQGRRSGRQRPARPRPASVRRTHRRRQCRVCGRCEPERPRPGTGFFFFFFFVFPPPPGPGYRELSNDRSWLDERRCRGGWGLWPAEPDTPRGDVAPPVRKRHRRSQRVTQLTGRAHSAVSRSPGAAG